MDLDSPTVRKGARGRKKTSALRLGNRCRGQERSIAVGEQTPFAASAQSRISLKQPQPEEDPLVEEQFATTQTAAGINGAARSFVMTQPTARVVTACG